MAMQLPAHDAWPDTNYLLSRVLAEDQPKLAQWMTTVPLELGQVLYEPGQRLEHVYLPTAGIISLIVVMPDGRCAETAAIGCEGAAGMSASGFVDTAFTRFQVQLPGSAQRVTAAAFEDMVDDSVRFCSAVSRYRDVLTRTTLQSVACNALHDVRRRCARWILLTHDRTDGDRLPMTQEFLAAMLGVKRNAISKVARDLQAEGIVEHRRGKITVVDRDRLLSIACDCYEIIHAEVEKLLSNVLSSECDD
ncbi:Crp/Fnr family transcriptional regulator [Glacieibacterium megasporae]|uniref:Crp/Fnr family transcriptional regulator n=1 Tax=Glacieibacterium megasporae TaxID=2835787 RepID=UPI0021048766|nr:Crp/Fnr family transcriptional regulator [Polymorphobacter megasporae]